MNIETFYTFLTELLAPQTWVNLIYGSLLLVICWVIGGRLKKSLLKIKLPTAYSTLFTLLAANIVKALCACAGILLFIGLLGINVSFIIKSIAILGFGVSFIFKDLMADVVSGFFIVTYKPFSIGTELTITLDKATYVGKIKAIDLRYITLENNTQTILVPNSFLFRQPLCITK